MPVASRSQRSAASVRDEILAGQYREGERLPSERDLALRFDVNRGAVREALKKLEQLGLTDIRLGGARVRPLEQASLDVIAHFFDLEDHPDPDPVEQVLEVFRGVTAMAVRLGVERASDEDIDTAIALVEKIIASRGGAEEQQRLSLSLSEIFVEASGNLVLRLVRNGIKMQFLDRLQRAGANTPIPRTLLRRRGKHLVRALRERDSQAAANEMFEGMKLVHDRMLKALREEPGAARAGDGRGDKPNGRRIKRNGRVSGRKAALGEGNGSQADE